MKPTVLTAPVETRSIRPIDLHCCTKEEILRYFENAYSLDEWVFTSLKDEIVFYKTPDRLRLPLIFYYAHTAVVFVNKLLLAGLLKKRINGEFEMLFETGVDEMSWDDTENYRMGGSFKWPPVAEARQYRLQVREVVRKVIRDTPLILPITKESKWWAVIMGIEHERIHLETSSVLIRQLPVTMVQRPQDWRYGPLSSDQKELKNEFVAAGDTVVSIGKEFDSCLWGWDNEYGKRELKVPKFEASKFLITNREFLAFVEAGGYRKRKFWSNEGWRWKTFREAKHPTFWICSQKCKSGCGSNLEGHSHCNFEENGQKFGLRLMFDIVSLPLDWPVEVNYLEAKAYCSWKGNGLRLPTEAEHHVMRSLSPFDATKETLPNETDPTNNIDFLYGSSTPVGMFPPSDSGFYDVFGNVWEWIEDHFNGLPGGETHYLYDDFSAPCFDGKHTMMTGGSWISTGDESSRYARFSFRRHFFQHMGFRVARTLEKAKPSPVVFVKTRVYVSGCGEEVSDINTQESQALGLDPILVDSTSRALCDDNEKNLSTLVKKQYLSDSSIDITKMLDQKLKEKSRAIVIGCGPGKIALTLTTFFDEVVGCDISGRCVDFAKNLAEKKFSLFTSHGDGGMQVKKKIELPQNADPSKVTFKHLTWIPVEVGTFDLVVVDGLQRFPNKKAWLAVLPQIVKNSESTVLILDRDDETERIVDEILSPDSERSCNVKYIPVLSN